jgi:hypothetical protein
MMAIPVEGGDVVTLLDARYNIEGLSWSPDGTRLIFAYGPLFHSANELYVLDIKP